MAKQGWLILHPHGWVETHYFETTTWACKGKRVSRETWRETYRPGCQMVRGTLTWPAQRSPDKETPA